MTLLNSDRKDVRWPLPKAVGWQAWFWSAPARPGLYGKGSLECVMVIGNCRNELLETPCPMGGVILALDVGGLRLEEAIAMRRVERERLYQALTMYGATGGQLHLPEGLAAALNFSANERWENWTIVLQPSLCKVMGWGRSLTTRLMLAGRLFIGQALLSAVPLLILANWQGLLWGWAFLAGAGVMAALGLPLFRWRFWLGVFFNCAIMELLIVLVMGLGGWWWFPQSLLLMMAGVIAVIWMALVLMGTSYSS